MAAVSSVVSPHAASTEREFLNAQHGHTRTYTPENAPPGVRRIVDAFVGLFRARYMQDYCSVMPAFSRDVVWDAPPILTGRKGHMRVAMYLAKFAALTDFEPALLGVKHLAGNRHIVEVTGTAKVYPRRTWLLWPTLLLPHVIPIRATVRLGVYGSLEEGQIDLIYGRIHNFPMLPSPLRIANGLVMGAIPHLAEPVWGRTMEFFGDDWYKRKRERHVADGTAGVVDQTLDLGSQAVTGVGDLVTNVTTTLTETARRAVDTTRQYADTMTQTAKSEARTAYENAVPTDVRQTLRQDAPASYKLTDAATRTVQHTTANVRNAAGMDPSGATAYAR